MDIINNYKKQTTKSWTIPWKYVLQCKSYKFCQSNYISNEIKKKNCQNIHIFLYVLYS